MERNGFRNDLDCIFEGHHDFSHDIKDAQRLPLTNGENPPEVDAKGQQEEEGIRRTRLADERRAKQLEIAEREARDIARQVVMGGSTLITYGAGFDVQHIICGYESCFLTIKNLPRDVQESEVEELFSRLGVNRNLFYIVKMQQVNSEVQAKVLSDSGVGQAIAGRLTGTEFRNGHYLDITVDNGPTPRRDINILTVNWALPSSTMVAQYSTEDAALNALNRLNNAKFRQRTIRVERYRASEDLSVGYSAPTPSIKISGLPLNVTTAEVEEYSDANLVWILTVLSGYDLIQMVEWIRRFEGYEANLPNPNSFNAEVQFQFSTWENAKRAQNFLEGWRLSADYPRLHAWLTMPFQCITTIPLPQYHAQKGVWDSMPVERDNDTSAFVRVINERNTTFILVLGKDKKTVGQLKVRVENLLAGETLDWRLWHRSFTNASGLRFLDDINARTKAYVRVDLKSKILKLYADRDIKQTVIGLLKAQIARLELLQWSIPIPPSTAEFFIRKGLSGLKEELGEDAATLEPHPTPRLIIRGGEEAHKHVDRLIEESLSGIEYEAYDGEKYTCPICLGKASPPVLLSCGHLYCADCLRHFLSSAAERKMLPLVCLGNEGRCGVPIAIPVIRRFLLQQQFDQLAEVAVKAYIEKQPAKFKYCATPDCAQTYRCREDGLTVSCPSCFTTVCSSCHKESHDGMTCKEKRIMDNPEEQERLNEEWARRAGAKRCPFCQIWIQKTGGCNHISCPCGAHICWKCLAAFSKVIDMGGHSCAVRRRTRANNGQPAQRLVRRRTVNHGGRRRGFIETT